MCPCEELCKLPDVSFIGGTTKKFRFNIFNSSGTPVDLTELTAKMVIVNSAFRGSAPLITINMARAGDSDNTFIATLDPAQTKQLYGKFIYQVTVAGVDYDEEPRQGNMYISKNIDS